MLVAAESLRDCAPHRALGWGGGPSVWRDDRARMARRRSRQTADLRPAIRLERPGDDTERRTAAVWYRLTIRLAAAFSDHQHLRSPNVLCQDDGQPLTRQMVQYRVLRASRRYMHLSPAALDSAIRLLDQPLAVQSFGDIWETGRVSYRRRLLRALRRETRDVGVRRRFSSRSAFPLSLRRLLDENGLQTAALSALSKGKG